MRFFFSVILIFFMGTAGFCKEPLKVGVSVAPPFVVKEGSVYTGIAIDLWNEVALGLNRTSRFVEYPDDPDKPFQALQKGEVDVFVGPLSMTLERYQKADFTLPYFVDKIVAVTHTDYVHNMGLFVKMFLVSVGGIIGLFLLIFAGYINLLWYYERAHTKNFPTNYKEGISHLFWTHVLNGHHVEIPKSLGGKAVILFQKGAFYVVIILLNATFVSFLTAFVVKYATPIQCLSDLEKVRTGAIKNSNPFNFATSLGVRVVPYESMDEGIKALEDGHIKAYLDDLSKVETYLKEKAIVNLKVSHFALKWDLYAFATPIGSPLLRDLNLQILELRSKEVPEKICTQYLPRAVKDTKL